jgi:hypothetical protein
VRGGQCVGGSARDGSAVKNRVQQGGCTRFTEWEHAGEVVW